MSVGRWMLVRTDRMQVETVRGVSLATLRLYQERDRNAGYSSVIVPESERKSGRMVVG